MGLNLKYYVLVVDGLKIEMEGKLEPCLVT